MQNDTLAISDEGIIDNVEKLAQLGTAAQRDLLIFLRGLRSVANLGHEAQLALVRLAAVGDPDIQRQAAKALTSPEAKARLVCDRTFSVAFRSDFFDKWQRDPSLGPNYFPGWALRTFLQSDPTDHMRETLFSFRRIGSPRPSRAELTEIANVLRIYALHDKSPQVRKAALISLHMFLSDFVPAFDKSDGPSLRPGDIRSACYTFLNVATTDSDPEVRKLAVESVTDQKELLELVSRSVDAEFRRAGLRAMDAPTALQFASRSEDLVEIWQAFERAAEVGLDKLSASVPGATSERHRHRPADVRGAARVAAANVLNLLYAGRKSSLGQFFPHFDRWHVGIQDDPALAARLFLERDGMLRQELIVQVGELSVVSRRRLLDQLAEHKNSAVSAWAQSEREHVPLTEIEAAAQSTHEARRRLEALVESAGIIIGDVGPQL